MCIYIYIEIKRKEDRLRILWLRKGGWNGMECELWVLGSFASFSFMTFWALY